MTKHANTTPNATLEQDGLTTVLTIEDLRCIETLLERETLAHPRQRHLRCLYHRMRNAAERQFADEGRCA